MEKPWHPSLKQWCQGTFSCTHCIRSLQVDDSPCTTQTASHPNGLKVVWAHPRWWFLQHQSRFSCIENSSCPPLSMAFQAFSHGLRVASLCISRLFDAFPWMSSWFSMLFMPFHWSQRVHLPLSSPQLAMAPVKQWCSTQPRCILAQHQVFFESDQPPKAPSRT